MERSLIRGCKTEGCKRPLEKFAKHYCTECAQTRRIASLQIAQQRFYARRRAGLRVPPSRRQLLRGGQLTRWSKKRPKLALKEWHRRHPDEEAPRLLLENLMTLR